MARLALAPGAEVEEAFYEIRITLFRRVQGEYSTGELGTASFKLPVGAEATGGQTVSDVLASLRSTFERSYGPVIPVPEISVVAPSEEDEPVRVLGF